MFKYIQCFVSSVLLLTVPSLTLYPQVIPITQEHTHEPLRLDATLSYDDILNLLDELESSELEKRCSEEDLDRIQHFLINLARQGLLPNEVEEESILENDIQELLEKDHAYEYYFGEGDYLLIPAFAYEKGEIFLCSTWFTKKWKQVKKFVKKHKKEIIIGTAVVVAAIVVVGAVAAITSAAGAAAGAAASGSDHDKSSQDPQPSEMLNTPDNPVLQLMGEQITSFKEDITKEEFFSSFHDEFSLRESGRILGSLLAHDSCKNLDQQLYTHPQLMRLIQGLGSQYNLPIPVGSHGTRVDLGHQQADRSFSTDYAHLYANPQKLDFNTLSYQLRGEKALSAGYFNEAIRDFGKAIELEPHHPLPYLERGVAHFGLGQYERSMEDYQQYLTRTDQSHSLSVSDFSVGFAKGLPKEIYDSGEGLFLFLSEFVKHPIHTSEHVINALSALVNLVHSDEWNAIAEVLSPEIHQLVTQWDTFSSDKKGELAGYAVGKHGADILVPGALAKVASKSVKSAQELAAVCKNLQVAQETLILETAAGMGSSVKIGEVVSAGQTAAFLGEELGFTTREMVQLKQAGKLEGAIAKSYEHLSPSMQESIALYKRAQDALKPYAKKPMPEFKVRKLIHETGIPTFPRPKGIPEDFLVMVSDKGAGMEYVHPTNTHIRVRVMPGKPHSPNPCQQKPYVIQKIDAGALDKAGKRISPDIPEAHIPVEEFIYRDCINGR